MRLARAWTDQQRQRSLRRSSSQPTASSRTAGGDWSGTVAIGTRPWHTPWLAFPVAGAPLGTAHGVLAQLPRNEKGSGVRLTQQLDSGGHQLEGRWRSSSTSVYGVRAKQAGRSSVCLTQQLDGGSHQLEGKWRDSSPCACGARTRQSGGSDARLAHQLDGSSHQLEGRWRDSSGGSAHALGRTELWGLRPSFGRNRDSGGSAHALGQTELWGLRPSLG